MQDSGVDSITARMACCECVLPPVPRCVSHVLRQVPAPAAVVVRPDGRNPPVGGDLTDRRGRSWRRVDEERGGTGSAVETADGGKRAPHRALSRFSIAIDRSRARARARVPDNRRINPISSRRRVASARGIPWAFPPERNARRTTDATGRRMRYERRERPRSGYR